MPPRKKDLTDGLRKDDLRENYTTFGPQSWADKAHVERFRVKADIRASEWRHDWPRGGRGVCYYGAQCEYKMGSTKLVRDMRLCERHRWEMGMTEKEDSK